MQVRYYDDPRSGQPHIYGHNVAEYEVEEVLDRPMEDRPGGGGVRIALGQTDAGRYLRVVYVPDPIPNSLRTNSGQRRSEPFAADVRGHNE